jgi:AraC-like DNA-binding protein
MIYHADDLALQILTIDRFTHKKGFFDVKARPFAVLSFRVSGTGSFQIGGRSFSVTPGDILFIPINTPYQVEYSTSESIVVHLRTCNYPTAELLRFQNVSGASLLFSKLLRDWQSLHSSHAAKATIYEILAFAEQEEKTRSIEHEAFARCLQAIEADFCDPALRIERVCKESFFSVSGLHRAFLRHFGMSPMQYVIKLRLEKALQLLAQNRHSIKQIASLCGFTDEKYFSRAVKQRYGVPPSKLRDHITGS